MGLSATVDNTPTDISDQDSFYGCETPAPNTPTPNTPTPNLSLADTSSCDNVNVTESSEDFVTSSSVTKKCVTEKLVGIKLPDLAYPKSRYSQWVPPLPVIREVEAMHRLISRSPHAGEDFSSFGLDDFTIYRTGGGPHADEMVPLHEVASKQGSTIFLFNGILTRGGERLYVQQVPFRYVSIGGYEDVKQHSVGLDLWIQSTCERRNLGIWDRLHQPASEYSRFHEAFLWLANLGKHLVDYIFEHEGHERRRVSLLRLKDDFYIWLRRHHEGNLEFETWISQYGSTDFRQAVVAHGDYLYKQALDIDSLYGQCQLWRELGLASPIVKEQPQHESRTVITPYVFDCFKHMDWARHLKPVKLGSEVRIKQRQRLETFGFVQGKAAAPTLEFPTGDGLESASILGGSSFVSCGDVIATRRDTETVWKGNHDDLWYALVQHISQNRRGRISLHVIWLYKPSDTVCANMVYPFKNELFMSDHCNCADTKIEASEVVKKVNVSFFSDGTNLKSNVDFFIRQSYHSEGEIFVTLKKEDFRCACRQEENPYRSPHDYIAGDAVLVECIVSNGIILEPAEITKIEGDGDIEVRELRRKRYFKDDCRPNELVYTHRFRDVHIDQIERRCHVRIYTQEELDNGSIPAPYNRDGNGDAFYIICQEGNDGELGFIQQDSVTFKLGFDPRHVEFPKLRALNIFSGGGSFDRGLEEGSAVQNEWAVEWGTSAMLTYLANHPNPEKAKLFCGSVNDYLSMAIRGKGKSQSVAQIGQPDFLSAGSPCQGYSNANNQKTSESSLRNCSMIASVMGFVDLYRFKYGLLENVTAMASQTIKKNPLSQILCCLVGMGYQCRILNLDAWSFGAPQSRSRLFVSFAAPGLKLPDHPQLTHSHPTDLRNRSLGKAANGLPFGNRLWQTPVFDFVTAAEAINDLPEPKITSMCISKPDHRSSRNEGLMTQTRINQIPKAPRIQGLADAVKRGRLNQLDIGSMPKSSKLACEGSRAWSRVHPHGLIPTVTTAVSPACRFTGRWLHWEQDRLLTVMEARRAQGYPDDEILVGRPSNQWKIVGNSVARQVALALGLSLREACLANKSHQANDQSVTADVENGESVATDVEPGLVLSETETEEEVEQEVEQQQNPASILADYFTMGKAVDSFPKPSFHTRIAVEIVSSHDNSSRTTNSARTTATITEPSSKDETTSSATPDKRGFNSLQPFVISDVDEEEEVVVTPFRKKRRKGFSGSPHSSSQNPIVLD